MTLTLKEFISQLKTEDLVSRSTATIIGIQGTFSCALEHPSSLILHHFIKGKQQYDEFVDTRNRQTLLKADEHFSTMVFLADFTARKLEQEEFWVYAIKAKKYRFISRPLKNEAVSLDRGIHLCKQGLEIFPNSQEIRMEGWYCATMLDQDQKTHIPNYQR